MFVRNVTDGTNYDIGVSALSNKKFFVLNGGVEIKLNNGFRESLINFIVSPSNCACDLKTGGEKSVVVESHEMSNAQVGARLGHSKA